MLGSAQEASHVLRVWQTQVILHPADVLHRSRTVSLISSQVEFDNATGTLARWAVDGSELLVRGPTPSFYRAPIDNDKGGGETSYIAKWAAGGVNRSFLVKPIHFIENVFGKARSAIVFAFPRAARALLRAEAFVLNMSYVARWKLAGLDR